MKKRLLSTVLVLALLGALCVPVCAAEAVDNRLARVTAQVKTTLQLNTDDYDKFYGDLMEDVLAPSWYLEWNGDGRSISVNATETGKVLSYHCYEAVEQPVANTFAPAFQQVTYTIFGSLAATYFVKHWKISIFPIAAITVLLLFVDPGIGVLIPVGVVLSMLGAHVMYKLKKV